ncbi:bifunctional phosphopantothenoylcysteine decarboxylase/phosphopantothenate--cysteine ligase CoaBC [Aquirufa sp. 5-AUSEE-100C1]
MFQGKKIILGISASIAAYKCIYLVRLLTSQGAQVRVVMTQATKDFVSPLVLSTFSNHPVWIDFHENNVWNNHVELGLWGDIFVIAPSTCNTLGKLAYGLCDNMLIATYLSARCPVVIAPAMDEDMYLHPATQASIHTLKTRGNHVLEVNSGALASGLHGPGRMAEPEEIVAYLATHFFRDKVLTGKRVLISAGPTQEAIDPVRFISNHSTGKMGIALANAFFMAGADVTLIAGPMNLQPDFQGITTVDVVSAADMENACLNAFEESDICIMAAAVADYRPIKIADQKIKKVDSDLSIELTRTSDILQKLGTMKKSGQCLIGFALETQHEEANAKAKLKRKNADFIILNSMQDEGAGFGLDTNQVTIYSANGSQESFALASKKDIANQICQYIISSLMY